MYDTLTLPDTLTSTLRKSRARALMVPQRPPAIAPDDVEAALLANYSALVRLAYLILPPTLGRDRRIITAHDVVQHCLPQSGRLERELVGERDAAGFTRRCVAQAAVARARARTPLRLLPLVWAHRLFARPAADDLLLKRKSPEARAAWALHHTDALAFDPCSAQVCPLELKRRNTRGRIVATTVTAVLAISILASLIAAYHSGR
jgi:hypothetical protein